MVRRLQRLSAPGRERKEPARAGEVRPLAGSASPDDATLYPGRPGGGKSSSPACGCMLPKRKSRPTLWRTLADSGTIQTPDPIPGRPPGGKSSPPGRGWYAGVVLLTYKIDRELSQRCHHECRLRAKKTPLRSKQTDRGFQDHQQEGRVPSRKPSGTYCRHRSLRGRPVFN
jgi:hypothetical protein